MISELAGLGISSALEVADADTMKWDDAADVVIVGFGAAGSASALQAREAGADTLIVERFGGGGAIALSGGVIYAGATRFQEEAGFKDTPDNMFNYLSAEVGDIVKESTLRRFCEQSAQNQEWLIAHGAKFSGTLRSMNAEYMEPGHSLYFSGNERTPKMSALATPAPRGHIYLGEGTGSMGRYFFAALRAAVERSGTRILLHSPVTRLIVDKAGTVIGVELAELPENSRLRSRHARLWRLFNRGQGVLYGAPARWLSRRLTALEKAARIRHIRARHGVVLTTGGFVHNRTMIETYLPQHVNGITLGAPGDTGAGISLGASIGAAVDHLDHVFTSRALQFKPYLQGMLVDGSGERFINEDAYGATIGREVVDRNATAWLILDRELYRGIWKLVMPWRKMVFRYRIRAIFSVLFGVRRGASIEALARKCGIPEATLRSSLETYNKISAGEIEDPFGKLEGHRHVLRGGPFYAIDCGTGSRGWPPLTFTLGGLRVDEESGQVLKQDDSPINNLYAAGRTAIGVSSNFYISGLSIADCIFSGRRAGKAIGARRSHEQPP